MPRTPRLLASLALVGLMSGCGTTAAARQHADGPDDARGPVPAATELAPISHLVADRLAEAVPTSPALFTPAPTAAETASTTGETAPAPPHPRTEPVPDRATAENAAPDGSAEASTAPPPASAPDVTTPTPTPTTETAGLAPASADVALAAPAGVDAAAEAGFLQLTNQTRGSLGVALLHTDAGLQAYARRQARAMADAGGIYHSDISSLLGAWSTLGENVGVGPSVGAVHAALVASPGHFRNLSDPGFTAVGVGVVVDAAGRIWTAHVFAA